MIPPGLSAGALWLALLLMLVSALTRRKTMGIAGWVLFGIYWLGKPGHYLAVADYFNAVLTLGVALFCLYMAWQIAVAGYERGAYLWASYAASICGAVYFPFVEVQSLNGWLIGSTASLTASFLSLFGVNASMVAWNVLALNGRQVEIVLACTAIESIALFAGVTLSVRAPLARKIAALLVSTLAIYMLNIGRNAFVLLAYGEQWFGENSFYIAHNVIAKLGSTLAILLIAYAVFTILPELMYQIDELAREVRRPGREAA